MRMLSVPNQSSVAKAFLELTMPGARKAPGIDETGESASILGAADLSSKLHT